MSDVELVKKLRDIGTGNKEEKHFTGLFELQNRIKTDVFISEQRNDTELNLHKTNLEFIEKCIDKYEKKILTPEDMREINILNRKYQRL
jgi:hypothetical protein